MLIGRRTLWDLLLALCDGNELPDSISSFCKWDVIDKLHVVFREAS